MRTVLASILLVFTACADVSSVDDDNNLDAPVGKADAASVPAGAYSLDTTNAGELTTLTLNADHTFTRAEVVTCIKAPCDPVAVSGTWLFTHSSTKKYIHFYDSTGASIDKWQWKLSSAGKLSLNHEGNDHFFAMARGAACGSVGGTCTALVPDACENGSIGDATQYSCGGGLGVECCLPLQADNSCKTADDCTGFLPQFVKQCSDGTTAGAHWECLENACAVASCN
ncbi:MAG: hypothetical protein QM831_32635 [Kofleriaceae bacterium]